MRFPIHQAQAKDTAISIPRAPPAFGAEFRCISDALPKGPGARVPPWAGVPGVAISRTTDARLRSETKMLESFSSLEHCALIDLFGKLI